MSDVAAGPVRILWVFAWLVVGGEETEVRLLAQTLDPRRYRIDVVACFRKEGMPEQTHEQLKRLGVDVDRIPYDLSFEDTVGYLATKLSAYDIVVASQNVADIYPALERLHLRPPLIEHGGLVSEALAGPKDLTTRYVGVCASIRDAAAARMPGRAASRARDPLDGGPVGVPRHRSGEGARPVRRRRRGARRSAGSAGSIARSGSRTSSGPQRSWPWPGRLLVSW